MDDNELQQKIVQVIASILGAKSLQQLEKALKQMSEKGRTQFVQFVSSAVQSGDLSEKTLAQAQLLAKLALSEGQAALARFGMKLAYINKLNSMR